VRCLRGWGGCRACGLVARRYVCVFFGVSFLDCMGEIRGTVKGRLGVLKEVGFLLLGEDLKL
jgi:hypothetical protein